MSDAMASFNKNCLKGLKVNNKRVNELLNRSLMLVTPLTKVIGYDLASKVALNAYNKNISLKESCMELTDLSEEEFNKYTDPKKMA
jgi:fumarate hydratase class II